MWGIPSQDSSHSVTVQCESLVHAWLINLTRQDTLDRMLCARRNLFRTSNLHYGYRNTRTTCVEKASSTKSSNMEGARAREDHSTLRFLGRRALRYMKTLPQQGDHGAFWDSLVFSACLRRPPYDLMMSGGTSPGGGEDPLPT